MTPPPPPIKARVPKPPPKPLDLAAVAEVVAPVPDLLRAALLHFAAADYDQWTHAGCRLLASTLTAIRRAELCRDMEGIREQVAFLIDYVGIIPDRLAGLRTSYWLNAQPLHLIRYASKPTAAMLKRQQRDEQARRLEKERRYAEAAAVRGGDD
jgi:hypothetical protein